VPADRQRMDIYRRLAVASAEPDIEQIKAEMTDIYGPISEQVQMLLDLTVLQIKAGRKKIKSIVASGQDLIFSFDKDNIQSTEQLFANVAGLVRIHDPQTVAVRLAKNYFEPKTLIALLRKILGEKK